MVQPDYPTVEWQHGALCSEKKETEKKEKINTDAWVPPQEIPVYLVWDVAQALGP